MKRCIVLAVLGLVFTLGCAGKNVQSVPAVAVPADPASYLRTVLKKTRSVTEVSGFASLKIATQEQHANSRNVFFVKRPGQIRIETLGFLSRPSLMFTADLSRMNLYVIDRNEFYTGESSSENFSRIIGLPLELPDIVESFLGQPPLHECPQEKITCTSQNGDYLFTATCADRKEQFLIDPKTTLVMHYRLLENGKPIYEYTFSNYKPFDQAIFPLKIEIYHYTYKTAISLAFESLNFDAIPAERFNSSPPPSAQVHSIENIGPVR